MAVQSALAMQEKQLHNNIIIAKTKSENINVEGQEWPSYYQKVLKQVMQ